MKTNNNASLKMRAVIKKSVQNKRWVKLTETGIDRKIIELLKSYTGLISSLTSLYLTLMKYVWSRENARKQKSHELGKEAKTDIVYLNSTEWDKKKIFQEQTRSTLRLKKKPLHHLKGFKPRRY